MKILVYLLLFLNFSANAQNLIQNGGFETLSEPIGFYDCDYSRNNLPNGGQPGDARCFPFYHGKVPNWDSYSYSAEIVTSTTYSGLSGNVGVYSKITTSSNGTPYFYEGIFQIRPLIKKDGVFTREEIFKEGKSYVVGLKFKFINGSLGIVNPSLKLMAGEFVSDRNVPIGLPLNDLNNPNNDVITITSNSLAENQWHTISVFYTPTSDKLSLAIVPIGLGGGETSATVIFDDVYVIESCCKNNQIYSNIFNPPSFNAQDYIKCNSNVTFTNNSSTELNAKNEVLLANNTTIVDVNYFIAQAEDCLAKKVEMYPTIYQIGCKMVFKISACYGSGKYEYYFNETLDADGEIVFNEEELSNYNGDYMTFKVKDIERQTIVAQTIQLPTKRYIGGISITKLPNVITPNGDGKNDFFQLLDDGKTSFAFNAYQYELLVWNRWGNTMFETDGPIMAGPTGFSENEVFWDGLVDGECKAGTYYYLLKLKNCSAEEKVIQGSITVICDNSFKEETNINDNVNSNINFQSEIYPNPTANNVTLKLFNVNTITEMTITNILGKEQNIDCKLVENNNGMQEYSIDCSLLNNGIYFCKINKNGITETIKFSIIK
jgi:hypothetical protein